MGFLRAPRGIAFVCTAVVSALLATGCDTHRGGDDAFDTARAIVVKDASLATRLQGSAPFVATDDGAIARSWSVATKATGLTFGARLPAFADDAIDVGLATTNEARTSHGQGDLVLALTHSKLAHAKLTQTDGGAVYRDVAPSTDLLVRASEAQVEWFYLLHDASAPTAFAIDLKLPRGIARARKKNDGSLAFLDANEKTRLAIDAPYAIDAHGTKRDVALAWDGAHGRLDLTLDPRELVYPIVIDPAVEHPVWEQVGGGAGGPLARFDPAFVYDAARGVTVLYGGEEDNGDSTILTDLWEWDGSNWTQRALTTTPSVRTDPSVAYDSARGKIVLFGGTAAQIESFDYSTVYSDTWEWDGTSWTQRSLLSTASPRFAAPMAYDAARGNAIVFGGYDPSNQTLGDTWTFDGTLWTQRSSATSPSARGYAAMAYDSVRQKTVLFGGQYLNRQESVIAYDADTWEWDGTSWTQRIPATSPPMRAFHSLAYDAARGKTLLFGGFNNSTNFTDTWEWDGTNWTQTNASSEPAQLTATSMTYDSARAVVVAFGGNEGNEIWDWNGAWSMTAIASPSPPPRSGAALAYDSARQRTVIFGGYDTSGAYRTDTWEWDGTTWTLRPTSSNPPTRVAAVTAYDAARARTLVFGGENAASQILGDLWAWDGTSWTSPAPAPSPPARTNSTMAYDSARAKTVLFGGLSSAGLYLGDTWEWDGSTWTQRSPATSPSAREYAVMDYDSARARTVLFGGYDYVRYSNTVGYLSDTWEWDGTNWTLRATTNAPPAGGSYYGYGTPSANGMAYDSIRSRSVLYGGQDGDGNELGQTWEWDGTNWSQVSTASPSPRYMPLAFDRAHGTVVGFGGGRIGNDTWLYFTIGATCSTTASCDTGYCTDGVCCSQSACGACQSCNLSGTEGACTNVAAGTVPSGTNPSACAAPNECTASGACTKPIGEACVAASDCFTGFCADGVCCDSACDGDCQACATSRGLTTNGTCAFAPEGTVGRNACTANLECNGRGTSCPTKCADDATCARGYYCDPTGTCVAQKQQGASCNDHAGAECLTEACRECAPIGGATRGQCVDGVCCDTPCDGACDTCSASGSVGTCAPMTQGAAGSPSCAPNTCTGAGSGCGTTCSSSAECASGAYCDATTHTCHGSNALGSACTNADECASDICVGGLCCRTSCGLGDGGAACQVGVCDPTNGFACKLAGNETVCRASGCTNGVQTFVSTCDGNGNCGALETKSCAPYVCGTTGCKSDCAADGDCASGNKCVSGMCVASAVCSSDGKSVVSNTGTSTACSPYLCVAGTSGAPSACATTCATVADCQSGFACSETNQCVASVSAPAAASNGGCGCSAAGSSARGSIAGACASLILLLFAWRRRRADVVQVIVVSGIVISTSACERSKTSPIAESVAVSALATPPRSIFAPLEEDKDGTWLAHAWSDAAKMRGLTFGARLARTASGAFDVGLATTADLHAGKRGDFVVTLRHEGFADAPIALDGDRATYRNVALSTDLIVSASSSRVEWFYSLQDAHAPSRFTIALDLPVGIASVRARGDGTIAFLDARGRARLAIPKAVAIDARGVRRDVTVAWDAPHRRLEVTLDPRGLTYPVLVDPALEAPVWELVASNDIGPTVSDPFAEYTNLAYDSARKVSVQLVGDYNTRVWTTWEWDGTTWTQRTPAGGSPVCGEGTMTYDAARAKTVLSGCSDASTWLWDGTTWTSPSLVAAPPSRSAPSMTYDSARKVVVLFGGSSEATGSSYGFLNDTWEWNGSTWTERTVSNSPPYRERTAMSYDSKRQKTVLFGGYGPAGDMADTWEWDGTSWTKLTPATSPPTTASPSMVYDSTRDATILFGTFTNSSNPVDTWEWNGTTWTKLAPPQSPSSGAIGMAYDSARSVTVVFGGEAISGVTSALWEWNGTTWTPRLESSTTPPGRGAAMMAFDSARAKSVLFGGELYGGEPLNDTWEWDGSAWLGRTLTTNPAARSNAGMAYDSRRGKTVLFGGDDASGRALGDTWEWDGTSWTQRAPSMSPAARFGLALAYDSAHGLSVLYGGFGYPTYFGDTWGWDGTTWTELATSGPPAGEAAMAYDSARSRCVLNDVAWEWDGTTWTQTSATEFPSGGSGGGGIAYDSARAETVLFDGNATWEWNGTTWRQTSTPSPSGGAAMAYDSVHGATVLFGAGADYDQTWLYFTVGGACSTSATCDTGACIGGVCCAQAQCGACQACNLSGSEGICTNVAAGTVPTTGAANACSSPSVCGADGNCAAPLGTTCASSDECASGFCVDGVCCDNACAGDCQACAITRGLAENGTCAFAPAGESGRHACANGLACDGNGIDCPTTCTDDSSCAPGFYCDDHGACSAQKTQGAVCNDVAAGDCLKDGCRECAPIGDAAAGQCVDGVCCDTACDGACDVCNASGMLGVCTNAAARSAGAPSCAPNLCTGASASCGTACASSEDCASGSFCDPSTHACRSDNANGSACTNGAECASGICVRGTCCATSCGAVLDGGSDSGASAACNVGVCDVAHDFTCKLAAGETVCRAQSCVDGVQTFIATCDGNGNCGTAQTTTCDPYACGANACNSTCAVDADCAKGSSCNVATHACVNGSVCSSDRTSVVSSKGAITICAPYVCVASACATSCATVDDCAEGYSCDTTNHCVAVSAATMPVARNGCSCDVARRVPVDFGAALGAFAAIALGRTRRRGSRNRNRASI